MSISVLLFTIFLYFSKSTSQSLLPKEQYFYNNKFYHYNALGVRWEEANKICEANQRHLVNPLNYETSQFLARQITKSTVNSQRMWIGGRKTSSSWIWTHTDEIIPSNQSKKASNGIYPPWDDPNNGNCLSLLKNLQNHPIFEGRDCSESLPFICEEDEFENSIPTLSAVEVVGGKEFLLYDAFSTWTNAMSFCYEEGYTLATVESKDEAEIIAKAMQKSRPPMENAWIGAYWEEDRWIWIHEGSEVETGGDFPIWMEETMRNQMRRGCVLLDRHLYENATFMNMKCDRQRNFVCMKKSANNTMVTLIDELDKRKYYLYMIEVTWDEALEVCKKEGPNVKMLTFRNNFEVDFVMEMMDDPEYGTRHVWVGGKSKLGLWWWSPDGEPKTLIRGVPNEQNFPPWCDNSVVPELQCLNLDRHQNRIPALYGLECDAKQNVICVEDL